MLRFLQPSALLLSVYLSYQIQWYLPLQLPPEICRLFTGNIIEAASRIAESTLIGIASFSAQEKSTISTASVLVTLRVIR